MAIYSLRTFIWVILVYNQLKYKQSNTIFYTEQQYSAGICCDWIEGRWKRFDSSRAAEMGFKNRNGFKKNKFQFL